MPLSFHDIPAITTIAALILLAGGLLRRSTRVTIGALALLIAVSLIAIPILLDANSAAGRDAALTAIIGLESAAAVAVAALLLWFTTKRLPIFAAAGTLVLGAAAVPLVFRAAALAL